MIISRTPLRVSFCGGGTDFREYYTKHGGAVVSTSIDKHVYIIVNGRSDGEIWLKYSQSEIVKNIDEIKHPLLREALRFTGIESGIEINSIADIPAKGSGLGGSSAFLVSLLNALYAHLGKFTQPETLARDACRIEREILREPGGMQDQYTAAYGGLNYISFNRGGEIFVNPVICKNGVKKQLEKNLLLFYTGFAEGSATVSGEQAKKTAENEKYLHKMKELADECRDAISNGELERFGKLLHENWLLKRNLASKVSSPKIDAYYESAIRAGALGGKLCGAGNGGYLMFYCDPEKQDSVRAALSGLRETRFGFEQQGSKIIYVEE